MKNKNLMIGLICLVVLVVVFFMTTKSQKPEEQQKFEIITIGNGFRPSWSPDGKKLAFMQQDSLCILSADGKGDIKKIARLEPPVFEWMSDSELVIWQNRYLSSGGKRPREEQKIEVVNVNGKKTLVQEQLIDKQEKTYVTLGYPFVLNDGTVGYYKNHYKPEGMTRFFKIIKEGKLEPEQAKKQLLVFINPPPEGGIRLESVDGSKGNQISTERKFLNPQLSPDGKKILVMEELDFDTTDLAIIYLDSNKVTNLNVSCAEVSPGVFARGAFSLAKWSPDSKQILDTWYIREIYEGEMVPVDLYLINAEDGTKKRITHTSEIHENRPEWSPDGTRIVCGTLDGKVLVIRIK